MLHKTILWTAAAALIPMAATAHPGGGGGGGMGGPPGGVGGMGNAGGFGNMGSMGGVKDISETTRDASRINSQDRAHASTTAANSQARLHSQGLMHASPTGIAHANAHSVLASGVVVRGSLAGLTTGLTVKNSSGTVLGTVSQIVTDSSGNIRLVIAKSSTGRMIRLVPSTLSLSGGVVTTTMVG